MKNEILKLGGYSFLLAIVLFAVGLIAGSPLSYGSQQIVGFIVIVTTLIIATYFSIKRLRDHFHNGHLNFGKAFMYGLLITFFVGMGMTLMDYIYTKFINPNFMADYLNWYETTLENTLTKEEFAIKKAELEAMPAYQKSSWYIALMMYFLSVFWGFFVSLAMAMILKRKPN